MKTLLIFSTIVLLHVKSFSQMNQYDKPLDYNPQPLDNSLLMKAGELSQQRAIAQARECRDKMKSYYNSLTNFHAVADGLQEVYSMDSQYLCAIRKVVVENGKITHYYGSQGQSLPIVMSSPITNAKCLISVQLPEEETTILEIYFFNSF